MYKIRVFFSFVIFFLFYSFLNAQSISGVIKDVDSNSPVIGALISITNSSLTTTSDNNGVFKLSIGIGEHEIIVSKEGYTDYKENLNINSNMGANVGTVWLESSENDSADEIFDIISLNDDDLKDEDGGSQNVSSLLTASRDLFTNMSAFTLGAARFRPRGYQQSYSNLLLNGISVGDLEDGRLSWSSWGGLNDVLRNRQSEFSLGQTAYDFGQIGGVSAIDLRASSQRKQIRGSLAISNRSYRQRAMLTYSTGLMDNGFAITLSGSRRWGNEGYIDATFYDAYSYFVSVDKVFNESHALNFVAFNAPVKRGRQGSSIQETNDILGTNYYNPNWGYQNGEKRNSRVVKANQPFYILRYDWAINPNVSLTTSGLYQTGTYSVSRLNWANGADPRPDYYRYLPSVAPDSLSRLQVLQAYQDHPERLQVNWDEMYAANKHNLTTIQNVDGVAGNSIIGLLSNYILEDQHYDVDKLAFNSNLQASVSDNANINGGISYTKESNHNYKKVNDLLGGDYFLDIDNFAERDFPNEPNLLNNDLNNPQRLVRVGDRYAYDYDINVDQFKFWTSGEYRTKLLDFHGGFSFTKTSFYREGFMKNGRFPEASFGKGDTHNFNDYMVKGGITYKLNGRNYFYVNGEYGTKAPFSRNSYISPRSRDQLIKDLKSETLLSTEGGYKFRFGGIKGRASVYYTKIQDQARIRNFYFDVQRTFVNLSMVGIDEVHQGFETAFEAKINSEFKINFIAAIGNYQYSNRPNAYLTQDNNSEYIVEDLPVYQKNFFVSGTPQKAYGVELSYSSPHFWFANLSMGYYDDLYLDFNPIRRTTTAVTGLDRETDSALFESIVYQEKLPSNYTFNFFGGKSVKFSNNLFLYLNVGVNNLLDNTKFRTGGYEQLRFDFENRDVNRFPPRYFYAYGRTYFISLTLRM